MSGNNVTRVIRGYEKQRDKLMVEIHLNDLGLKSLQNIFEIDESNKMYDCYPVGSKEKDLLLPYLGDVIDIDNYDYFLECYTKE